MDCIAPLDNGLAGNSEYMGEFGTRGTLICEIVLQENNRSNQRGNRKLTIYEMEKKKRIPE